jgi:hypothetical protein
VRRNGENPKVNNTTRWRGDASFGEEGPDASFRVRRAVEETQVRGATRRDEEESGKFKGAMGGGEIEAIVSAAMWRKL